MAKSFIITARVPPPVPGHAGKIRSLCSPLRHEAVPSHKSCTPRPIQYHMMLVYHHTEGWRPLRYRSRYESSPSHREALALMQVIISHAGGTPPSQVKELMSCVCVMSFRRPRSLLISLLRRKFRTVVSSSSDLIGRRSKCQLGHHCFY